MTDTEFDQRFSHLGGIEPSELLQARTLAAWRKERARGALAIRAFAALGMAAMAAAALLSVDPPERGTETMVQRGTGEAHDVVTLKMFVKRDDATERFAVGRAYHAGDTLVFRVHAPSTTKLTLYRDDEPLWSGSVPAEETTLPVSYTLESGEPAAIFRLVGGADSLLVHVPAVLP